MNKTEQDWMDLLNRVQEGNKELLDSGYICDIPKSLNWEITEIFNMSENPEYKAGFIVVKNTDGFLSLFQFSQENNYNLGDIITLNIVSEENSGNYGVNISSISKSN